MKKPLILLLAFLLPAGALSGQTWEAGLYGGLRTVKDDTLKAIYGNGFVYAPFVAVTVAKSLRVGVEFEGGFDKEAGIGLFADPSRLQVRGTHVFLQYGNQAGRALPYFKFGMGVFSYRMDIDSPYVKAFKVNTSDVAFFIAWGLRISVTKAVFAGAELKYGALWADPFDDMVDLGGVRAQLGLGFVL